MEKARIPCGPILSTADICENDQYRARGMIESVPSATTYERGHSQAKRGESDEESYYMPAMLPVMSRTPGKSKWAGPELGQHTREVTGLVDQSAGAQD
eukprot:scaffold1786_cov398-Prasinococcus_capsulatus_cf.AAC.17